MKEPVSLKPFQPSHLLPLTRWLASPAVARWYPDPESEIKWASQPPNGGTHAVIAVAAHELGYIRWQRVDRDTLDSVGMPEVPDNSVDVDILMGRHDTHSSA